MKKNIIQNFCRSLMSKLKINTKRNDEKRGTEKHLQVVKAADDKEMSEDDDPYLLESSVEAEAPASGSLLRDEDRLSLAAVTERDKEDVPASQVATQPLEPGLELECSQGGQVWGQLYPHCGTFPRIRLDREVFRLGRAADSDYVVRASDMGSEQWRISVSNTQCEIWRDRDGVWLKDCSLYGTWVNGRKVGRGNTAPLSHNAEICFVAPSKKVLVFMSSDPGEDEVLPAELTSRYAVSRVLGRGTAGEVRLAFRLPDLHPVAIKIIRKQPGYTAANSRLNLYNEVRILQTVSHPCIIKLEDVIDTPKFLFIVLELADGGELFDKIVEKSKVPEGDAKLYFYQICSAIEYLHAKGICHRDLKPENILLCSGKDSKLIIKLSDLGLSKLLHFGTALRTFCGTEQYMAPEVLPCGSGAGEYTLKADCWSLGVILYIILSGAMPFVKGREDGMSLHDQISNGSFIFYGHLFHKISQEALDLIKRLLTPNPEERLSIEDTLNHPWLQDPTTIQKAKELMSAQQQPKAKKRLLEDLEDRDIEQVFGKKVKIDGF